MEFDVTKLGQQLTEAGAEYAVKLIEAAEMVVAHSPDVDVRVIEVEKGDACAEKELIFVEAIPSEKIAETKQAFKKYAAEAKQGIRTFASSLWTSNSPQSEATPDSKGPKAPQSGSSPSAKGTDSPENTPTKGQVSDSRPSFSDALSDSAALRAVTEGFNVLAGATTSAGAKIKNIAASFLAPASAVSEPTQISESTQMVATEPLPASPPLVSSRPEMPAQEKTSVSKPFFPDFSFNSLPLQAMNHGFGVITDATVSALNESTQLGTTAAMGLVNVVIKYFPVGAALNYSLCKVGPQLLPPYRYYSVAACGALSVWNSVTAVKAYEENKTWFNAAKVLISSYNLFQGLDVISSVFDGGEMGISSTGGGGDNPFDPGVAGGGGGAADVATVGGGDELSNSSSGGILSGLVTDSDRMLFGRENAIGYSFLELVEREVSENIGSSSWIGLNEVEFKRILLRRFNAIENSGFFSNYSEGEIEALSNLIQRTPRRFIQILHERATDSKLRDFFGDLHVPPGVGAITTSTGEYSGTTIVGEVGGPLRVDGRVIRP